jgi:osmotically-inducible protein OsmY
MKTDTQLKQDVISELEWDPAVNANQIGVEVINGIVTLAGHVASFAEKWQAERAANRVSGVNALAIEMDVRLPGSDQRTDADIAQSAQNVLEWSSFLPKNSIKVRSESGWVTLSGEVSWNYQRRAATNAVRFLMGVKGITDHIAIRPKPALSSIKAEIEAALLRRLNGNANNVVVEVHGDNVTLSGTVNSWFEREQASHSAWGTPGVQNVVDRITISS